MEEALIDNAEIEQLNRTIYISCIVGLFLVLSLVIALIIINTLFTEKIWI